MDSNEHHGGGHTPRSSSSGTNVERHGGGHTPKSTPDDNQGGASSENQSGDQRSKITSTGFSKLWHCRWRFRRHHPHFYREADLEYDKEQQYVHLDILRRKFTGPEDDRYISPNSGKIRKLLVQSTYSGEGNSTYRRTRINNAGGQMVSLAGWATDRPSTIFGWIWGFFKYILASICIGMFFFFFPTSIRRRSHYAPFQYAHYTYAVVPRNVFEECPEQRNGQEQDRSSETTYPPSESKKMEPRNMRVAMPHPLFPRWLCFLQDPGCVKVARVDQPDTWPRQVKRVQHPNYLFVAYTSEQFKLCSKEDMQALDDIAEAATRYAGLDAYWLGSSCMDKTDDAEDQVYWISDIVRSAHLTCMAIGPSDATGGTKDTDLMRNWGSRIWTFPEVLLSRAHQPILVVRRGDLGNIEELHRTQFPAKVWDGDGESRRLIDHFNGTLHMSNLELMTTALQCLRRRSTTNQHFNGDHSYALMGLVNIRPRPIWADSAFQAFARLSLANNSEKLLERLICVLPRRDNQEWWDMNDAFSVNLWDIYPSVQIAGICGAEEMHKPGQNRADFPENETGSCVEYHGDDAVIIDGMFGAAIRWKSFHLVQRTTRFSCIRFLAYLYFVLADCLFIATSALGANIPSCDEGKDCRGPMWKATIAVGVFFAIFCLSSPCILQAMLCGRIRKADPALFGFEGYLPIDKVERRVFGAASGQLQWSPWATPLSRHKRGIYDECIGIDPVQNDKEVAQMVLDSKKAKHGEQRIFTLVDTGTLTVTMFQAARPPAGLLVCGSEGGMQRVLGVSYDWKTKTCFRETVFRMPTSILNHMLRVPKVKLGLKRKEAIVTDR